MTLSGACNSPLSEEEGIAVLKGVFDESCYETDIWLSLLIIEDSIG